MAKNEKHKSKKKEKTLECNKLKRMRGGLSSRGSGWRDDLGSNM